MKNRGNGLELEEREIIVLIDVGRQFRLRALINRWEGEGNGIQNKNETACNADENGYDRQGSSPGFHPKQAETTDDHGQAYRDIQNILATIDDTVGRDAFKDFLLLLFGF